jgi:ATP-binding cassette subfamily F protein 3
MLELQTKKHALEARLSAPLPPQEIGEIGLELQKIDEELAGLEEKWLLISEAIEAAE